MQAKGKRGWKPSPFDARDFSLAAAPAAVGPGDFRLRDEFPPKDQGDSVPCCVSAAVTAAMELLDQAKPPAEALSMLFHYYTARADPRSLGGLSVREGLDAAVTTGICTAALHNPPMSREGALLRPSDAAFDNAKRHRLVGFDPVLRTFRYYRLADVGRVDAWRSTLRSGMPLVVGFWLTAPYAALTAANPVHGAVDGESSSDGHAVAVCGFDDARTAMLVKDSRGDKFADRGWWWLPYDLVDLPLVQEAWAIGRVTY